jgi:hypothetical protein
MRWKQGGNWDSRRLTATTDQPTDVTEQRGDLLSAILFNRLLQCFHSSEVAERITDLIIEESKHGEQHVRDYLRRNLEFSKLASDEIAEILFRSEGE